MQIGECELGVLNPSGDWISSLIKPRPISCQALDHARYSWDYFGALDRASRINIIVALLNPWELVCMFRDIE